MEVGGLETKRKLVMVRKATLPNGWQIKFLIFSDRRIGFVFENGKKSFYLAPNSPNKKQILKTMPKSLYITYNTRREVA